ncbi:MAG: C69 family dipeptidase [Muribaculaceae bacterium]|nr:C69 family dipeptidase [Muribaculaceae bacterium]
MLKRFSIATAMFLTGYMAADACTSLIAGRDATADGSVMITYAADSHNLYGELYNQPAADHAKGTMRKVVEWDTGKYLGEIPEVSHTYATIGNMNEHGLAISESTWGGREELVDTTGIIDYGSLIYITLQRAKTAREAIQVMTGLVEDYGYASSGESFSIADGKEAWLMELIGKGGKSRGAVWVARRVPDDCISGHANHSRIHQFPLDDKENCLYSPDVIDFARSQGYFSGKDEDFSFSLAYAITDFSALRGCDGRVWAYFNRFNNAMETSLPWILKGEGEPMPLWVKPDRKISVREMQWMMRDHFEGTPMDMTKDIGAGAYTSPYRWRPLTYNVDGVEYSHERAIATQQTGFSFVAQLRDNVPAAMKGVLWFGVDDANTCVYVPVYCCVSEPPHCYAHGNGDMYHISWDAAFWVHNYVANQSYHRYSQMIPDIRKVQNGLEDAIAADVEETEKTVVKMKTDEQRKRLTALTNSWAEKSTKRFKELGDYLLVKYLDGNVKREKDGKFEYTPEGVPAYPSFPGYNEDYYRTIVKETGDRLRVIQPAIAK